MLAHECVMRLSRAFLVRLNLSASSCICGTCTNAWMYLSLYAFSSVRELPEELWAGQSFYPLWGFRLFEWDWSFIFLCTFAMHRLSFCIFPRQISEGAQDIVDFSFQSTWKLSEKGRNSDAHITRRISDLFPTSPKMHDQGRSVNTDVGFGFSCETSCRTRRNDLWRMAVRPHFVMRVEYRHFLYSMTAFLVDDRPKMVIMKTLLSRLAAAPWTEPNVGRRQKQITVCRWWPLKSTSEREALCGGAARPSLVTRTIDIQTSRSTT